MSSPYRFVTSNKRGQYSVHRGETPIGHVVKVTHQHWELRTKSASMTTHTGWQPYTLDNRALPIARTRELAAAALWARPR